MSSRAPLLREGSGACSRRRHSGGS